MGVSRCDASRGSGPLRWPGAHAPLTRPAPLHVFLSFRRRGGFMGGPSTARRSRGFFPAAGLTCDDVRFANSLGFHGDSIKYMCTRNDANSKYIFDTWNDVNSHILADSTTALSSQIAALPGRVVPVWRTVAPLFPFRMHAEFLLCPLILLSSFLTLALSSSSCVSAHVRSLPPGAFGVASSALISVDGRLCVLGAHLF